MCHFLHLLKAYTTEISILSVSEVFIQSPPLLLFLYLLTNVLRSHVLAPCKNIILFDDQVSRCNRCVCKRVCHTNVMQHVTSYTQLSL